MIHFLCCLFPLRLHSLELLDQFGSLLLLVGFEVSNFFQDLTLGQVNSLPRGELNLADRSLPSAAAFLICAIGWEDSEEIDFVFVLHILELLQVESKVYKELKFRAECFNNLVLRDASKGVTHDRDQHVEHGDLGENGGKEVDKDADDSLRLLCKGFNLESVQGLHVLAEESVWQEVA